MITAAKMLSLLQLLLLTTATLASAATTTKPKLPCSTKPLTVSGAKNTSSISTYTTYRSTRSSAYTTYSQYTVTSYQTAVVKTVTSTSYSTRYITKAGVTKTVPTPSGFLPFTSVNASIRPIPPTTYAYKTICTTTVTSGTTTYSYDSWRPDYTTWVKTVTFTDTVTRSATKNVTVATPTATVYAACVDKTASNVGTQWKGKTVNVVQYTMFFPESDLAKRPPFAVWQAANQSPLDCCNAAFALHELALNDTSGRDVAGFIYDAPKSYDNGQCKFLSAQNENDQFTGISFWTGSPPFYAFNLGTVLNVLPGKKPVWVYEGECSSDYCYRPIDLD